MDRALEAKRRIQVDIQRQELTLWEERSLLRRYRVSTARNGSGEYIGSGCTPLGLHRIRLRIGGGCPEDTVFRGRRPTGEIYGPKLEARFPERDWILTRILWLTGLESGFNRGGEVDTLRRFIYIHGCPDSASMGAPLSHGCIRMHNRELLELFDLVEVGTQVDIVAGQGAG